MEHENIDPNRALVVTQARLSGQLSDGQLFRGSRVRDAVLDWRGLGWAAHIADKNWFLDEYIWTRPVRQLQ